MEGYKFLYSEEKNKKLIKERGVSFEEIIQAIMNGNLLAMIPHTNLNKYPKQELMYVRILESVYTIPFVRQSEKCLYLKTIFPSRKAKKKLLITKDKKKR